MTPSPPLPDLWIDLDEEHGTVHLGGQLDPRGCAHLGTTLLSCICRTPAIDVIDIRDVEVLSPSAIQLIDTARHLIAAHGRTLRIVCRPGRTTARTALAAVGLGSHVVGGAAGLPA